ncbi:MAG: deoxyguanosinetriphosphate triphosphohydrolase [Gammaproteobacteria bacterium]
MTSISKAPYSSSPEQSRGRVHREPPSRYRTEFQRDRDRIIHSTAFRRLEYKTQVFVNHEGDLYRTRLTHSLEVAQVGRTAARALALDEDLIEAICLAHDLGHTPFGHAGQDALNACMRDYGGFEHNFQSLRVVDVLEHKYPEFSGLNLTFETREGILKHCSAKNARTLGDLGTRFLERTRPSAEAQLADLADSIAYNHHDVDDGYRSGLLTLEQLRTVPLFNKHFEATRTDHPTIDERRTLYETVRRMFGDIIHDLISHSRSRLEALQAGSPDDVRQAQKRVIALSAEAYDNHMHLKSFLRENLYRHPKVVAMTDRARTVVQELFTELYADLDMMPDKFTTQALNPRDRSEKSSHQARIVADYIAGMTDRYAFARHKEICG